MHLLFVTSLVPDGHATSGYEIANQAIIDGLRPIVLGSLDVRTATADRQTKLRWVAGALAGGHTISSVKMRALSETALRQAMASRGPYDAYVLNGVSLPGAFPSLFNELPSLWVAHNVEFKSARENVESAEGQLKKLFFRREARLLETIERNLAKNAQFIFTLAEEDREPLGVNAPHRSAVLPLITTAIAPISLKKRDILYDAGLIGTWTWEPNRVGLDWFVREVAPLLPADFKVAVAGQLSSPLANAPACIEFLGRVPDAKAFVNTCAVIPLVARGGTGVQLKTIETFEAGLPSVATNLSLRGINARPSNCAIADDPQTFAKLLIAKANAIKSGKKLDLDGRSFYEAQRNALDAALKIGISTLRGSNAKSKKAA
jgi:Glycosyl transferases group 1